MIIKVPATSANLGSGYDTMGLSLDLYNEFNITRTKEQVDEKNLVYRSFKYLFEIEKEQVPKIKINIDGKVPIARGLGSSATCIVAGLVAANIIFEGKYGMDELLKYATAIEGHPDNVGPALMGGLVISTTLKDEVCYYKLKASDELSFIVIVPDYTLETRLARSLVPKVVKLEDAIYNISHSNLISRAIERGDMEMLRKVYGDRLHEPYREKLIPDFSRYKEIADKNESAIFISGAGSSMLIIADKDNEKILEELKEKTPAQFKILKQKASGGAKVIGKDF